MRVLHDLDSPAWDGERSVITIGAYDGVHVGHQAVIAARAAHRRADRGAAVVVVTFDRHPASIVRPESAPQLLTDLDQKLELLAATGVDAHRSSSTSTRRQAAESPESFVKRVLVDCLATQLVVVGEDFHFGHHRSGNVALLARARRGRYDFDVQPVPLVAARRRRRRAGQLHRRSAGPSPAATSSSPTTMLGRPFEAARASS